MHSLVDPQKTTEASLWVGCSSEHSYQHPILCCSNITVRLGVEISPQLTEVNRYFVDLFYEI